MAREFAKKFYKSENWKNCRAAFIQHRIQLDGGLCSVCHKAPGYIVHHKVWLSPSNIDDPLISLNFDNLDYLCTECHSSLHNSKIQMRCSFDENGRPIENASAIIQDNTN